MSSRSARLTIFEGPDGAGKTTAALEYAKETGARYVHLGAFPSVMAGLPRMYVEAMMPAILGHCDVVMDRCWISEPIYGTIYRSSSRLSGAEVRSLERLAMRCSTVVVRCLTSMDEMLKNWSARKSQELVKDDVTMRAIAEVYRSGFVTSIPVVEWNYLVHPQEQLTILEDSDLRTLAHPLKGATAGNIDPGSWLMVGESFANHTDCDPLYQWPFGSFWAGGASRWLTNQLTAADIGEERLAWINADDPSFDDFVSLFPARQIVALGNKAVDRLTKAGYEGFKAIEHPSFWKRFRSQEQYPLSRIFQEEKVR